MEPKPPNLRLQHKEKAVVQSEAVPSQTGTEFGSVEEMLRFDAAQVSPPESVVTRLQESIAQEPAAKLPWWRRWFSK